MRMRLTLNATREVRAFKPYNVKMFAALTEE